MKITIDLDEIKLIAGKADKLLITKEAEKEISKILEAQEKIEEALKEAKAVIEKKALEINPNFKSVEGDLVKASYRFYGQKYYLEEDKINQIPEIMYVKEVITKYKPQSDMIDMWIEKNGGLPYGISAPQRIKSLTISFKKNHDDTKD
jgi:hypothetical protein